MTAKQKTATLLLTANYSLFEMNACNRPLHDTSVLEESMRRHGFFPSCAIHCKRGANGKLLIVRGHHRYSVAKSLGIPLYYIIDETNCDIFDFEGVTGQNWSVSDFLEGRARAGDKDCAAVLAFKKKHCLTTGAAANLVGGHSAHSGNKSKEIKTGRFHVGDMQHANAVVGVTDLCQTLKVAFATSSAFVAAVSAAIRIPEFDVEKFKHQIRKMPALMQKRGTSREYLEEIEEAYNYGAKSGRLPVKYRAEQIGRERQATFGGKADVGRAVGAARKNAAKQVSA